VITLKGLKRQLLLGLDTHVAHLLDFLGEDDFGLCGRVDAVGFDGDENAAADLEEKASIETDDTCLICRLLAQLQRQEEWRHIPG
jgi:hypothetical protein